jgi:hypothetical protein
LFTSKLEDGRSGGWVEVGKLLIILTAVMAVRNSFGVFFNSIEDEFGLSRGQTSIFLSASMVLSAFFTVLAGRAEP